jgi:hypothetical protein
MKLLRQLAVDLFGRERPKPGALPNARFLIELSPQVGPRKICEGDQL